MLVTEGRESVVSLILTRKRGKLCPMAMHVAFEYVDIIRYGGTLPTAMNEEIRFCCSDSDVINIFRIDKEDAI